MQEPGQGEGFELWEFHHVGFGLWNGTPHPGSPHGAVPKLQQQCINSPAVSLAHNLMLLPDRPFRCTACRSYPLLAVSA